MPQQILVKCCDTGAVVEVRGWRHPPRERFVTASVEPWAQVTDDHDGEPLAGFERSWITDGALWAMFDVHPGCGGRVQALLTRSRGISLEFTSSKEVRPDATIEGWSVLEHRGVLIAAVALTDSPARSDGYARLYGQPEKPLAPAGGVLERRSYGSRSRLPAAVEARYFDSDGRPKTAYGAAHKGIVRVY